ncbi:ribosome recycling factor [Chloroflexota bacterium]
MVDETLRNAEQRMNGSVNVLKSELASIRTGRATPALIEHVKAEYGGVPMPLNQMATISAPEARLLIIQPWDRGTIRDIEKAILKSDLGLNPANDGNIIRLSIPPLTEERRQELVKLVHRRAEERKVAIRNLRRDAMEELRKLEKSKDISQDEYKRGLDQLQKITDSSVAATEQLGHHKEVELMEV